MAFLCSISRAWKIVPPIPLRNVCALAVFSLVGCAAGHIDTDAQAQAGSHSAHADVVDRWIYAVNAIPSVESFAGRQERRLYPNITRLMDEYIQATLFEPARHGRLSAIAVDDDGRPVHGVTIKYISIGFSLFPWMAPPTKAMSFEANGEFELPWPRTQSVIHLDLYGPAYRTIAVDLAPHFDDEDARYRDAENTLESGRVLPPLNEAGPIRIVVPPALTWDPALPGDIDTAPFGGSAVPAHLVAPPTAKVLVDDDDGQFTCVSVRGVYALVDPLLKVKAWAQLDKGMRVGLSRYYYDLKHEWVKYSYMGDGGGELSAGGPYKWVLLSTPHKSQ